MSPKGGFQLEVSSLKLEVFLTADFTDGADFFSWQSRVGSWKESDKLAITP